MGEGDTGGGGGGGGKCRKLTVEICNARNLMPKDGQGTASAYAMVDFDGQRRRTRTCFKDLNPQWDEKLEFLVHDPEAMTGETLEVNVYNDKKTNGGSSKTTFLGRVRISGASFVEAGSEALVYYPLEKRSVFSQVKGEIGLKVCYADEESGKKEEKKEGGGGGGDEKKSENKGEEEKAAAATGEPAAVKSEKKGKDEKKSGSDSAAKKEEGAASSGNADDKNKAKKKDGEESKAAAADGNKPADKPADDGKSKDTKGSDANSKDGGGKSDQKQQVAAPMPPEAIAVAVSSPAKPITSRMASTEMELLRSGGDRPGGNYDLVQRVPYLFVRLLKPKPAGADRTVYAKVSIGTYSVKTRVVNAHSGGEWDQVFAFHKASLNSTALDISVWAEKKEEMKKKEEPQPPPPPAEGETKKSDGDKAAAPKEGDNAAAATPPPPPAPVKKEPEYTCLGVVSFDLQEIPQRSPPDSPLAPQWYSLEGENAAAVGEDVMLAAWVGTQADEAFQEAWHSDAGGHNVHTRSKAYLSPKLWYLRLTVIQTQDLRFADAKSLPPGAARELSVKAQLGNQVFKTARPAPFGGTGAGSTGPAWNEDLVFVAAEPFDPFLVITVEDGGNTVGHAKVHVSSIHRRVDDKSEAPSRWFNLAGDGSRPYAGRIHVRVCLEGGYHVLDEAAHVTSDVRAASKQLSKPPIGLLEVGIRGATNLLPMKSAGAEGGGTTDAYVVVKYGPKWARTRTLVDQYNPRWNEQYAWEVFDPCTVLTVGVFDNGRYQGKDKRDVRIGKARIRLSTLDANRVYLNSYPLTLVHPCGAKKMGEIELAVRFTCPSWITLIQSYASPMLPRMHYVRPLGPAQQDLLRHTAMRIVSARLARSEPPLGPEVVQHMLDTDSLVWSMRRCKANWFRVVNCLSWAVGVAKWLHGVRSWQQPTTTVLVHILLAAIVFCPQLILPTVFMYLFLIILWRYRARPRGPAVSMDPKLSCVDVVGVDELDEEFDPFPTARPADQVRARYDRLRALAGRAQVLLGDVAAQGERVEALMSWRDPRATGIFVVFCLLAAFIFYAVPFPVMALGAGMYYLRHPRFRDDMPPPPVNFFRRLPSLSDRIL